MSRVVVLNAHEITVADDINIGSEKEIIEKCSINNLDEFRNVIN